MDGKDPECPGCGNTTLVSMVGTEPWCYSCLWNRPDCDHCDNIEPDEDACDRHAGEMKACHYEDHLVTARKMEPYLRGEYTALREATR